MLYALVVIYNKNCYDSQTLNSLKKYSNNIKVIVFDNSISDYKNREYCEENNYDYYTFNKNVGLSKAYNYVIDKIQKDEKKYLIVLDDDTELSKDYFTELDKIVKLDYDIILPIVKSNNKIISPSNVQFNCRVKNVNSIEKINFNKITAINSGMIVNVKVYNSIKYNENMFLDYVDHDFMRNVRKIGKKIYIMNSNINQNFSSYEKVDKNSRLKRFNIYFKDFYVYCKQNFIGLLFYKISILKLKIKYSIEYKTLDFFNK